MRFDLWDYQRQGLQWMLYREGAAQIPNFNDKDIPYWWDIGNDLQLPFELMGNFQHDFICYGEPVRKNCKGGILADEMGLGKTIMVVALILAHREGPTLIVVPQTIINQWKDQIEKFSGSSLKVFIHLGRIDKNMNLETFDVVLTTEGKIRAEFT